MDERLIIAGLVALSATCVILPMRLALLRSRIARRSERPKAPKSPIGDPRHLPYVIAPSFLLACLVFALGGPLPQAVAAASCVFFGALAISLKIYRTLQEKAARPPQLVED